MSRRYLLPTSTTLALLLAVPVLAQTPRPTTSPAPLAAPAPATSTSPAGSPANASGSASFTTSDQQIRASKLIGSTVYNDQNQKIGSIDELLLDQNHAVTSAVLSVGGFLGLGSKLVKVPYQNLHVANNEIVMPGASKDELKNMPAYNFHSAG